MIKNSYPKISIVTPSFNQGSFIEQTIKSVINQQYPNLEYIIIDGGSTDNTIDIIKQYEQYIDYWVSEPDGGQSQAINKGFSRATGDIYYWINSDDYLLPNALHTIASIDWGNNVGAVVGVGHKVNLRDQIVYTPDFYEAITTDNLYNWTNNKNFMQPACFFTKKAWDECGPLNKELHFCMDVDLWLNISKKFSIKRIKQSLAHAYIHDLAKTTAEVEKMKMETYLMIASHGKIVIARSLLYDFFISEEKKQLSTKYSKNFNNLKKYIKNILYKLKGTK